MDALASPPFRLASRPEPVELVAKYFRALGDPVRLRVLRLLGEGERSVGELAVSLGVAQPRLSNHLACLRWCGFVETRREHRTVYYRLADERVSELLGIGDALLADNAAHVAACCRIEP